MIKQAFVKIEYNNQFNESVESTIRANSESEAISWATKFIKEVYSRSNPNSDATVTIALMR